MKANEIKKLQPKVEQLLRESQMYRDSDEKLWARIIQDIVTIRELQNISGYHLLRLYVEGKLPTYDSVTRARRKIQEAFPELRGYKYEARHKQQTQVKSILGYNS